MEPRGRSQRSFGKSESEAKHNLMGIWSIPCMHRYFKDLVNRI